ncbi:hypothetical protein L210DRAFT_3397815, partial [Boletus edulis BED1]
MISQSLVDTNIQQQYHKPSVNHATSITTATKEPFIHDAFLTKLNLVVNAEFHILICQLCKEGIPTPTTRSHIVNKHPELCSAFSQVQLDDVIRKLQLVASLPTAISGPRSIPEGYGQYRIFWEVEIVTDSAQDPKEVMVAKLMEELNEELKVVQVPTDHRLLIDSTDELVLQRLNSPDPTKQYHTLDTTLKQYIIPIVCLLAMLLR